MGRHAPARLVCGRESDWLCSRIASHAPLSLDTGREQGREQHHQRAANIHAEKEGNRSLLPVAAALLRRQGLIRGRVCQVKRYLITYQKSETEKTCADRPGGDGSRCGAVMRFSVCRRLCVWLLCVYHTPNPALDFAAPKTPPTR